MASWGAGNQLTTSGTHLYSFASVENLVLGLVWMFEGKAIPLSPKDPGDSCQIFSGLGILVLTEQC